MSCHDLAVMGATLANRGINPVTGVRAIEEEHVKDVLAIMYTCGMYDFSGEAYRVGLSQERRERRHRGRRAGQAGYWSFSPRLDARCNSAPGIKVCQELSRQFGLHVFESFSNGRCLFDTQTTVLPV